ncbi:hypothetical protein [Chitinophaga sp. RAB17]|uniref:hypothetical protein n=1 Tax=Chitinophaga sp. RAB17 TaxID=3233049 RepID=UPI003F900996
MKKIVLLFALLCLLSSAKAQLFCDTVITFARSAPPLNGVKIKTNLPFINGGEMPTIIIEGYNQGTMDPIGLIINFYISNGAFANTRVSSFGSYTPPVSLGNENNKVVIFLDSRDANQRFAIRAFAKGLSQDIPANYQGWSIVDEALPTGPYKVDVTYMNKFPGTVLFPGNGIWNSQGRIGLHTTSPAASLHIVAAATDTMAASGGAKLAAVLGNAYNEWTAFGGASGGRIRGSNEGYLVLETNNAGSNNKMYLNTASAGDIIMASGGGKVGIGTAAISSEHRLTVEGSIGARRVQVTSVKPWPDYVFGEDYTLTPLSETEKYVKANKHLPDMPSAKEVADKGIDLGEMNRKLLEKMEEMTLHMIRMQKKIDELEGKIQGKP